MCVCVRVLKDDTIIKALGLGLAQLAVLRWSRVTALAERLLLRGANLDDESTDHRNIRKDARKSKSLAAKRF